MLSAIPLVGNFVPRFAFCAEPDTVLDLRSLLAPIIKAETDGVLVFVQLHTWLNPPTLELLPFCRIRRAHSDADVSDSVHFTCGIKTVQ